MTETSSPTPPPVARRAVPFWAALDEPRRAALRAAGRSRPYPARAPLCVQGDASDHVVVVESGWAKVTSATADGHDVVLAVRGPGDLVCESAVLGSRERSATVTTLGPLRGLVVSADRFTAFLDANPALWRLVSGTMVGRLDAADRRVRAQVSARGPRRLALLLAELAELSDPPGSAAGRAASPPRPRAVTIAPPLSQEELGSWMDASRETVARALNELRHRGLVETGWRRITVLDPSRLRAFARSDG